MTTTTIPSRNGQDRTGARAAAMTAAWFAALPATVQELLLDDAEYDTELAADLASFPDLASYLADSPDYLRELVETATEPATETAAETEPETEPVSEQDAPTHTVADYKRCLAAWEKLAGSAAEQNYAAAALALDTVVVYQGTSAEARRSTAIGEMAAKLVAADDDCLYPPAGADIVKYRDAAMNRERKRVSQLVQAGALTGILFGTTVDKPIVGADGKARKAGARGKAMPWRRVRELLPLVVRPNDTDERHERWTLLPYVEEEVRALVLDMVSGLKAEDVVHRVRQLCLDSAKRRLEAGDKTAVADVEYWGGKIEKTAKDAEKRRTREKAAAPNSVETETDIADDVTETDIADVETETADVETEATETTKTTKTVSHRETSASPKQRDVGTVKDCAESIVALFKNCDTPDDLFAELIGQLKNSGELLSNVSNRAIHAALLIIARGETKEQTAA